MGILIGGGNGYPYDGKYIDYGDGVCRFVPVVELTDACIEQIVEEVVKKLRGEMGE